MAVFPRANTGDVVVTEAGEALVVQDRAGKELGRLDPLAFQVCQMSDGSTPVPDIANAVSARLGRPVSNEAVWSALDRLADFGLLEHRVTPPAAGGQMPRRGLLTLGIGVGGAIASAKPSSAAGEEERGKEQRRNDELAERQRARDAEQRKDVRRQGEQRAEGESKDERRRQSEQRQREREQQRAENNNKNAFERGKDNQRRDQELGNKEVNNKRGQAQESSQKSASRYQELGGKEANDKRNQAQEASSKRRR